MNETWTRRLLFGAALWNLTGGITSLADPANHFAQMYTVSHAAADPLLTYFYQCTWINVIAWGLAYGLAGWWPVARAAVLLAGAAGKAAYFVACAALVASGVGKPLVLAFGIGDLVLAVLFATAFVSARRGFTGERHSSLRVSAHGRTPVLQTQRRVVGDAQAKNLCHG